MKIEIDSDANTAAKDFAGRTTATWKAMRRSMQRTVQGAKAYAAKSIRDRRVVRLSSSDLKNAIDGRVLGDSFARSDRLTGRLTFSSAPVSISRFYARTVRIGKRVGVEVRSLDGRKYRVGFPLETHKQADGKRRLKRVTRMTDKTIIVTRVGQARLPIRKVFGASIADIVRLTTLQDKILAQAQGRLAKELAHNLRFYMKDKSQ